MGTVTMVSLVAGLADLVGGWWTLRFALTRERLDQLMAVGAGFLLGGALFTMLPEAMHASSRGALYVAAGYLGLLVIRRLFAGGPGAPAPKAARAARAAGHAVEPAMESAWAAVVGLALHSFVEGAALGAAAQVDDRAAIMALLAIFLHKLPEGFSLAAVVLAATESDTLALLATAFVGAATVLGAWGSFVWASAASLTPGALLGIAAGSFLYVGCTDMLPSVLRKNGSIFLVLVGAALVYLLTGMHGHSHLHVR